MAPPLGPSHPCNAFVLEGFFTIQAKLLKPWTKPKTMKRLGFCIARSGDSLVFAAARNSIPIYYGDLRTTQLRRLIPERAESRIPRLYPPV